MSPEEAKMIASLEALRAELKALCVPQIESPMVVALKKAHDSISRFDARLESLKKSEPAPVCPCFAAWAAFRKWRRLAVSWLKGEACRG